MSSGKHDAIVVGSGPNGLAAAVQLVHAGLKVLVLEAADTLGGGMRSAELTFPGFVHDICSTLHPLAAASPAFARLQLNDHGLEWIRPPVAVSHPLDDGTAVLLEMSLAATASRLGEDGPAYERLMGPLVKNWSSLLPELLAPLHFPRHPLLLTQFGLQALRSAESLVDAHFTGPQARALFGGIAAHSMLALDTPASAAVGLVLGASAHVEDWPMPRGGAQKLADALVSYLRASGVEFVTNHRVKDLADLPEARVVLLDITPRQFLQIASDSLPQSYRKRMQAYRYGPGVFRVDWALSGPVPWTAEESRRSGVVHIGGTFEEIAASELLVWHGRHPERPYVLLAQQTLFDPTRAPEGHQTLWGYCHVPNGSTVDMTAAIEQQIERFAPGFRDLVLARHTMNSADMEAHNANYVGGDINGGLQDLRQMFRRPVGLFSPYRTPLKGVYLCSSSTPPGGGVHGMCGYHAARRALRDWF